MAAVLMLLAGCGTSEYERRRQAWLESYVPPEKQQSDTGTGPVSAYDQLYAATELAGTPIRIRMPQSFKKATRISGQPNPPARLRPPFALPGFQLCYEGSASLGSQTYPFYCYLAVVADDFRGPEGESLEQMLADGVRNATEVAGSWDAASCPTPGGGELSCRLLQWEGTDTFYLPDKNTAEKLPGWLQIYIVPQGKQQLIVVWRAPNDVLQPTQLRTLAPLSVGTTTSAAGD